MVENEYILDIAWHRNTLEVEDILPIVRRLAEEEHIDLTLTDRETHRSPKQLDVILKTHEEGLEHVAKLIHRVYQWSQEILPQRMGGFLTAVVENDLEKAVALADSTNVRSLPIYFKYFYNYAPMRWRTQKTHRGKAHDQQSRSLPHVF